MSTPGVGPQGKRARKAQPSVHIAGWYSDPLGLDGERYWDGAKWTENFVPTTMPARKLSAAATVAKVLAITFASAVGVGVIIVVLALIFGGGGGPKNTGDLSREVIDACQEAIKNGLKDPDSAKFYDWSAREATTPVPATMNYNPGAGDRHWTAAGTVNAKNSFGGYNGQIARTCDVVITPDGYAHAQSQRD